MCVVLVRKLFLNGTVLKNLSYLILSYPPSLDFPTVWVNDSELIGSDSESSSDILGPLVHQENMKLLKFYLILLNPLN